MVMHAGHRSNQRYGRSTRCQTQASPLDLLLLAFALRLRVATTIRGVITQVTCRTPARITLLVSTLPLFNTLEMLVEVTANSRDSQSQAPSRRSAHSCWDLLLAPGRNHSDTNHQEYDPHHVGTDDGPAFRPFGDSVRLLIRCH